MKRGKFKRTPEIIQKQRESMLKRYAEFETRRESSEIMKKYYQNHPHPRKGKKHTSETKEKMRKAMFRRLEKLKKEGKPHFLKGRKNLAWKGKHHSPETIERLRKANLGKNNPQYGKSPSKETREKLRRANTGQKRSKEFIERAKIINSREKNPGWKGGIINFRGYIMIHSPDHPYKTHFNKIKNDNRPENLMAFKSNSIHRIFESGKHKIDPSDIIFDGRKLHF